MSDIRELMNATQLNAALQKMAAEIAAHLGDSGHAALVGIRRRGDPLAERIQRRLRETHHLTLPLGRLDITLYRDDLSTLGAQPMVRESDLPFDPNGTTVILVDDVIYTGRTARAAIDAIIDFGRPRAILLAALIDRGWREYPIQPDFCAMKVETTQEQIVQVRLREIDGVEEVLLVEREIGAENSR